MDACHEPGINKVVAVTCTQSGKSTAIENILGRFCHVEPCPIIIMVPTVDKAEEFSKERFAPMIRDTPVLRERFARPKARDSGNTILTKNVKGGGHVAMVGANSPSGLASRPRRIALIDELDRIKESAGTEGNPLKILEERLSNYFNSLEILTSTPGDMDTSDIWREWLASDQRFYNVPCPRCGEYIVWEYRQLDWDTENGKVVSESVEYTCQVCQGIQTNTDQHRMLAAGRWIPTRPTANVAGFHLWKMYSPWVEWATIGQKRFDAGRDPALLKVWWNTTLGLPWEEKGEIVDYGPLLERRESYGAAVPDPVILLTAGIDTQDDRIEVSIYGWARGEEAFAISHRVLDGDPNEEGTPENPNVWTRLDDILFSERFTRADGRAVPIVATCIDSGGHRTTAVYNYCRPRRSKRVYPIVGRGGEGREIIGQPSAKRSGKGSRKTKVWVVGTYETQSTIYSRLRMDEEGPGYVHYPKTDEFSERFFKQLTAYIKVPVKSNGVLTVKWKLRKGRRDKEAIDCFKYAFGALRLVNPKWDDWERRLKMAPAVAVEDGEQAPLPIRAKQQPKRKGGFVRGWKA